RDRQREGSAVEALTHQPRPGLVDVQDTHLAAVLGEEDEEGAIAHPKAKAAGDDGSQLVETGAKNDGGCGDVDKGRSGKDHGASRASTTARSSAGSKPGRTRTTRPEGSKTSSGAAEGV